MTVLHTAAFGKQERLTTQIQAKVTPSEYQELVEFRDELRSMGLTDVTISSLVRTFVVTGLRANRAAEKVSG